MRYTAYIRACQARIQVYPDVFLREGFCYCRFFSDFVVQYGKQMQVNSYYKDPPLYGRMQAGEAYKNTYRIIAPLSQDAKGSKI